MKRRTTLKGAPRNRITLIKAWVRCWEKELGDDDVEVSINQADEPDVEVEEVEVIENVDEDNW